MEKFEPSKALKEKAVILKSGDKAYVKCAIVEDGKIILVGYLKKDNKKYPIFWDKEGKNDLDKKLSIEGMWSDSYIESDNCSKKVILKGADEVITLAKPFKPKDGEKYYFIRQNGLVYGLEVDDWIFDSNDKNCQNHICYRTKKEAEDWLKAMKGEE